MQTYFPLNLSEEAIKARVAKEFFSDFAYEPFGRVDFCISYQHQTLFEKINFLWAEAKKGKNEDIYASFVQLVLTIGKAKLQESLLPPSFLGAFDCEKIAFLPYYEIMSVFSQNDFNWNVAPSNHNTKEFHQLYTQVKSIIESKKLEFYFSSQKDELQDFISANFTLSYAHLNKIQITKDNFVNIYLKWLNRVRDSISIDFDLVKPAIIDADFYLADLLSYNNTPTEIIENLRILLENDTYKVRLEKVKINASIFKNAYTDFGFRDGQKAHNAFWNIYDRPPKEEFQSYILERRDLLVPEDIRERKGSFFTPPQWVKKAQEYLCDSLSQNAPYYIWDCAAGTGNLLAGLNLPNNPLSKITDKYKIYASTIDESDVDIMKEFTNLKQEVTKLDLLPNHIFQFDFLNDKFFDIKCKEHTKNEFANPQCPNCRASKLPQSLQKAIKTESHKIIVFINPPYAEASSYGIKGKSQVANTTAIFKKYANEVGAESLSELFAQFFIRIYKEIPDSILASFSTPKYIKSEKFVRFRAAFRAKFLKGFMCPADTFDNVNGQFPISFMIWNTGVKNTITSIKLNVFDRLNVLLEKKRFSVLKNTNKSFPHWRASFYDFIGEQKAQIIIVGPSMQSNDNTFITNKAKQSYIDKKMVANITAKNLIHFCVYFSVRHCIQSTWINDSDRFLHPSKLWENDREFQNDCLAFTLLHKKNRISIRDGQNHFIPFSESQVEANEVFDSHFIYDFINGKCAKDSTRPITSSTKDRKSHLSLRASKASVAIHKTQIDCHESANADSRNDITSCHTSAQTRSISNNPQNRDISRNAQYDNRDSSVATLPQNDKDIDCHEVVPTSRNDKKLFELESTQDFIPTKPLEFSEQAQAVFSAGLELWRYYHKIASDKTSPQSLANPYSPYNANASLYDIKEFFKGRKPATNSTNADTKSDKKGKLNATSNDRHFNALMASLNEALQNLAKKLESKIYEYEFLQE